MPYGTAETYVAIHVTSDITGKLDVKKYVHVQIFFDGNISLKARDIVNETGGAGNPGRRQGLYFSGRLDPAAPARRAP